MKYQVTEKDGVYTATIPLPMYDGRTLLIQGRASVGEVLEDFGYTEDEVGFSLGGLVKGVGKVFKGIAKSKAIRKAVGIAKDVIKNPITTAALGVVTGGAAVPALTAANAAIRIAEAAKLGGSKGAKARTAIRTSLAVAKRTPPRPVTPTRRAAVTRALTQLRGGRPPIDPALANRLARLRALKAGRAMPPRLTSSAAVPDLLVKLQFA